MIRLWREWRWRRSGRPTITYDGFHCGCCGRWWGIPFEVRTIDSAGRWWDTWGLCPNGSA